MRPFRRKSENWHFRRILSMLTGDWILRFYAREIEWIEWFDEAYEKETERLIRGRSIAS